MIEFTTRFFLRYSYRYMRTPYIIFRDKRSKINKYCYEKVEAQGFLVLIMVFFLSFIHDF